MRTELNSYPLGKGLRIFRTTYTDHAGVRQTAAKWYVEFRYNGRPRRVPAYTDRGQSEELARQVQRLAWLRETNGTMDPTLAGWIVVMPPALRERLTTVGVLDGLSGAATAELAKHLEAWRGALLAKGNTAEHAATHFNQVTRICEACGFATWRDFAEPGAGSAILAFLGGLRAKEKGGITGETLNKYVKAMKAFCRWMIKDKRAASNPLAGLDGVSNAEADAKRERRALTGDEQRWLLKTTAAEPFRHGLDGAERALLYRFAFESGLRPKQIRGLVVESFELDAEPPTVTAAARFVKRRRRHTQVLTAKLAEALRVAFKAKLPSATAFTLPRPEAMVVMFRADLDAARAAWIKEADPSPPEQLRRQRSDFLARRDHAGQWTVFYSLRHGHGTALAEAGVAQKDIAASLHHTRTSTTDRYVKGTQKTVAAAIAAMPDYSVEPDAQEAKATGTDGKVGRLDPRLARSLAQTAAQNAVLRAPTCAGNDAAKPPPQMQKSPEEPGISLNSAKNQGDSCKWAEAGSNRRHMDFQSIRGLAQEPGTAGGYDPTSESSASRLARRLSEYPELAELADAWPQLDDALRNVILRAAGVDGQGGGNR